MRQTSGFLLLNKLFISDRKTEWNGRPDLPEFDPDVAVSRENPKASKVFALEIVE